MSTFQRYKFARVFDLAPDVGFRRSWYRRKACAAYFCKVPDSRESELGFVRYGPANRGHRGVFGPFGGTVFRSGFRLDPVKSWRSESSTSCMDVSSFQRARARGSTCCESGRLCAQAWQRRWENSGNFSTTLFRRPVFTRVVDVAPDVGFRRSWYRRKACATYFSTVQALHRGELGFARYDLANRGRRNVPYAKGMVKERSVRFSFRSGQRSGQTLVKLGQPWSNLVEFGQSSPNSGKCIPDRVSRVFGHSEPQSGQKRSGQTLVKLGQLWSNLVKLREDVSRTFFLGSFDVVSLRRVRPARLGLSRFACRHPRKSSVGKNGVMILKYGERDNHNKYSQANREFHAVAGVVIFCKVPDLRESELGFARYGSANRGRRGVFGPFEDSFPIRILEDSARKRGNVGGKNSGTFSKTLFRRPVFTCMVDVAPDVGFRRSWYRRKAYATYFPKKLHVIAEVTLLLEVLSSRTKSLRVGGNFHANTASQRVVSSIQFLVWSMTRSNFGQTWSTLVKLGQTWSKLTEVREMYPGPHFEGFLGTAKKSSSVCVSFSVRRAGSQPVDTRVKSSQVKSQISRSGSPFALLRYVAMCASFYGAYVLKTMG
uniref:Uncharacterized protein n=1 Tax=Fagus sylvatica TaxID=28930 RepID=A0A2N9ILC2_FAGSY